MGEITNEQSTGATRSMSKDMGPGPQGASLEFKEAGFWEDRDVLSWNIVELSAKKRPNILSNVGSGKTSLLECLSLRNRRFTGALTLNNEVVGPEFYTQTALVHQTDLLFGFLTVREHLTYHAIARLGRAYNNEGLSSRVSAVIAELGLDKCADSLIGGNDALFLRRGISGGERKRVTIATEILRRPLVLLLDEPTSGLDSVSSEVVLWSLSRVASAGTLVVASLHCPSSLLTRHFTHLLLLTCDGQLAYHGPFASAAGFFKDALSLPIPPGFSDVEFLLDMVSSRAGEEAHDTKRRMNDVLTAFRASALPLHDPPAPETSHHWFKGVSGQTASTLTLCRLNVWRTFVLVRRDTFTMLVWCLANLAVGVVFGSLYMGHVSSNWRHLMGLSINTVDVALFMAGVGTVVLCAAEWTRVLREILAGINGVGPFLLGKATYNILVQIGVLVQATSTYWFCGYGGGFRSYIVFSGIVVLVSMAGSACGMLLSSFSANPLVGLALVPAVFFPMITFCGILYQRSATPAYLKWMEEASIVNYGFSAIVATQAAAMPPQEREGILRFCEVEESLAGFYISRLCVVIATLYVLSYISLRARLVLVTQSL